MGDLSSLLVCTIVINASLFPFFRNMLPSWPSSGGGSGRPNLLLTPSSPSSLTNTLVSPAVASTHHVQRHLLWSQLEEENTSLNTTDLFFNSTVCPSLLLNETESLRYVLALLLLLLLLLLLFILLRDGRLGTYIECLSHIVGIYRHLRTCPPFVIDIICYLHNTVTVRELVAVICIIWSLEHFLH